MNRHRPRTLLLKARGARRRLYRATVVRPRLRRLPRERRDACWCGGALTDFELAPGFGVFTSCGTWVNRFPVAQAALERLYGLHTYWTAKQRADGMPVLGARVAVDAADGRVDRWLELVRAHHDGPPGVAVEVGCSHGMLLERLAAAGWACVGVEVDPAVAAWTAARTGVDIRAGIFPGVELPRCDVFLSFDVLEHARDPLEFLGAARSLLRPGGLLVLQTAIEREGLTPPFGSRHRDAFDRDEHTFLFTQHSMRALAVAARLDVIADDERLWRLGELVVLRRPAGEPPR